MEMHLQDFDFSKLSDAERIFLAGQLLDSVHEHSQAKGFSTEQLTELKRRVEAADAGTIKRVPWDIAYQRLSQGS